MNFVKRNWKVISGILIFILIVYVINLRERNETYKEEIRFQEISNISKQCFQEELDAALDRGLTFYDDAVSRFCWDWAEGHYNAGNKYPIYVAE